MRASVIILGVLLAAAPALAEPVRVVGGPFPPFRMAGEGMSVRGVDADIVHAVFARAGYEVDIVLQPFLRAMNTVRRGEADAIAALTHNAEREAYLAFSGAISAVSDVFFKRAGDNLRWVQLDDLRDLRVGASQGYNYAGGFWEADWPHLKTVITNERLSPEEQLMRLLARDRIDIAICEVSVCGYLLRNRPDLGNQIDFMARSVGPVRTFHLGFSRRRPDTEMLLADFDAALAAYKAEGAHRAVYARYGVPIMLD